MRKILLFIAAFIFALVTMPLILGLVAEHRVKSTLAEANLPGGMIVEVKSYELGYLKSKALVNVTLLGSDENGQPDASPKAKISFNIQGDIQHGPLFKVEGQGYQVGMAHLHLYTNPQDLALGNETLAKTIGNIFQNQEVVLINATMSLTGNMFAQLQSSPANYKGEDGSITWPGSKIDLNLSRDGNAFKLNADLSPMLLQTANRDELDFSEIKFSSNAKRKTGLPWVGEQLLDIPSLFMRNAEGKEVRFSNLIAKAKTEVEGKLTQMELNAKADNLEIFSQVILDTTLGLSAKNLDAKHFVKFGELSQTNVNAMTKEQKIEFIRTVITMLSPGASFDFQHNMTIAEGPVTTQFTVAFPNLTDSLEKETNEVLSQRLMKEVNATVSMQSPKNWLENTLYNISVAQLPPNAPSTIDPVTNQKITPQEMLHRQLADKLKAMTQSGILVGDETHYAFHFNYNNGAMMLNGNKLTQDDLAKIMGILTH